jgi:hypothetical protein
MARVAWTRRETKSINLVDIEWDTDNRRNCQSVEIDHLASVCRGDGIQQAGLGGGIGVLQMHPPSAHRNGPMACRSQQGLIDRVPRHQVLSLRSKGLGLGCLVGRLRLGQQRSNPLEDSGSF